jgi:hypothetical protein
MRQTDGPRATTAAQVAAPEVAPRFTRAAQAERSRLEGKREQLLRKREEVEAELARIGRAVGATDELLELLAPLLATDGSELGTGGENDTPAAEQGASTSEPGQAHARDRAQR